jgi:hypothetical protein
MRALVLLLLVLAVLLATPAVASPVTVSIPPVYIVPVVIDNTRNPNTLTNYQVLIVVNTASLIVAGKLRSDCADLFVLNTNDTYYVTVNPKAAAYPSWVEPETCNTMTTRVWVKVPSIPGGGKVTLYLRYGNGNVTGWTGRDVFDYFDDFSAGLSSSYVQEASGWTVSNGVLVSPSTASANNIIHYPVSLSRNAGWAIRARVYISASAYSYSGVGFIWGTAGGGVSSVSGYIANYYYSTASYLSKISSGSASSLASLPLPSSGWYMVDFIANSTKIVVVRNGALDGFSTDTSFTSFSGVGFRQGVASTPACDWWAVRKYSSPEPVASVGNEQLVSPYLVYTLSARYTVSVLDSALATLGSTSLPAGTVAVYLYPGVVGNAQTWYLKLNSTLLYSAQSLNNTVLNVPGSYGYTVTFMVSSVATQPGGAYLSGLNPSSAVGWLSGYSYRKEVFVLGSSSGAVSYYPVPVTVYYGSGVDTPSAVYLNGKCREDFSDVAFTANDGKTMLKSWLRVSVPGRFALFWVEVPAIPPYPSVTSFYVYYGAGQSVAVRSMPGFYYYDSFDGYADNIAIPVQGAGNAVVTTVNATKVLRLMQTNSSGALTLVTKTSRYGRILLRVYIPALSGSQGFYAGWSDGTQFSLGRPLKSLLAMLMNGTIWVMVNNRPMIGLGYNVNPGWYTLDVKWYNQFLEVTVVPESSPSSAVTFTYTDPGIVSYNYNYLTIGVNSTLTCLVDYVGQSNYIEPEPSIAGVGTEERLELVIPSLPSPGGSIVISPIQDPSLQKALSDPVARYLLEMMFVFSLFIAITRFEPRIPVALAETGIIVVVVGVLIGDTNLVVGGAVLIAVGVAWGLM